MPKRPIPMAVTTANAPGVRRAWQDRIFNMYAELPAPRQDESELRLGLRSVSGERLAVSPRRIAEAVGRISPSGEIENDSILGFAWVQHHSIPQFQNKILIVGVAGVALLDPTLGDAHGFQVVSQTRSNIGIGANDLGAEVMIVGSGFSWLITQPASGRSWIYQPVASGSGEAYKAELTEIEALEPVLRRAGVRFTSAEIISARERGVDIPLIGSNSGVAGEFGPAIFHGNRYIVVNLNSGRFFWSGVAGGVDQHIFFADAFASAESDGDNLVSIETNRQLVYALGSGTAELWYQNSSRNPTQNFGPYIHSVGSDQNRGCVGHFAKTAFANRVFWLSHDGSVFTSNDRADAERITSPALAELLDTEVRAGTGEIISRDLSRARLFSWSENGHDLVAIRPESGWTYVYDLETGAVHQRGADYLEPDEDRRPWRIRDVISSTQGSANYGRSLNAIYELTPEAARIDNDKGEAQDMRRSFTTPLLEMDREEFQLNDLEVLSQGDDDEDQALSLEVSRNRGFSWSPLTSSTILPEQGGTRFEARGQGTDLNLRFSHASQHPLTIFGIYADITPNPRRTGR